MTANKYLALAATSARERVLDRTALVGRMGFYAILLFIFSQLWEAVLEREAIGGFGPANFVWYIAITEWIVLSLPEIYVDVERDVHDGDLAYRLTRPVPYPVARLAEAFGDALVRLASLGVVGFALAWTMTGTVPIDASVLALLLPLGMLSAATSLAFHFTIGLSSFWIHDCRPVYWVWQKCGFVLGGLLVPLELYPAWLSRVALLSPFAAMLNGPGRLALGGDPIDACVVACKLVFWLAVAIGVLALVYHRAVRRLTLGGG
jgi:ABC-2 type transport system permease protein